MEVVRSEDDEVNFESDLDPSAMDSEQKKRVDALFNNEL